MSITPNLLFFFFNDTATTEIYTLSLHDALPIYDHRGQTIEKIRTAIVRLVHYDDGRSDVNLSSYLADELHRSEEHTSELQSRQYLVCRLLLEKKKKKKRTPSL